MSLLIQLVLCLEKMCGIKCYILFMVCLQFFYFFDLILLLIDIDLNQIFFYEKLISLTNFSVSVFVISFSFA